MGAFERQDYLTHASEDAAEALEARLRAAEAAAAESEAASAEAERRAAAAAAMATAHEDVASSQAHISEQVRSGLQHLGGLGKALRVAAVCRGISPHKPAHV